VVVVVVNARQPVTARAATVIILRPEVMIAIVTMMPSMTDAT